MSLNDLKVIKHPGYTRVYKAEDTDTSDLSVSMKPGEPAKIGGTGSNFVTLLISGDPVALANEVVGIVRKESTETATADGEVDITLILPVKTVVRGRAQSAGNIDTANKIAALQYDWVTFDIVAGGGAVTINENEGSDRDVHGLCMIDFDVLEGTIDVIFSARVTQAAPTTVGA